MQLMYKKISVLVKDKARLEDILQQLSELIITDTEYQKFIHEETIYYTAQLKNTNLKIQTRYKQHNINNLVYIPLINKTTRT